MGARISGLNQFGTSLSVAIEGIGEAASEAAEDIAIELASRVERDCPVDTGALRRSIDVETTTLGSVVSIGDELVDYAGYVEDNDPFIQPNINAMRREANGIAEKEIGRRLR